MQIFRFPLRFHSLMGSTAIVLALGLLVTGGAIADDLRPAKAWLDDIPATPRTLDEVSHTCSAIRDKGKAIQAAYERESESLDAEADDPEEMSEQQMMAMLMQGGGMQEMQQFAQAQMQMEMVDEVLNQEVPTVMKHKQHAEARLDEVSEQLRIDRQCKDAGLTACAHFGEGMTAADIACHDSNDQKWQQCRREAATKFLQAVRGPLQKWKGELRRYLDASESYLLEQEAAHRNEYLRAQWKRQRIELLEQAADYASMAGSVCGVEHLQGGDGS